MPAGAPFDPVLAWRAGLVLVALATLVIGWVAIFHHPIGDSYTESDFYGSYAHGARLVQSGHFDPARYGVVGPVYETALALAGFVTRDLFAAAKFVSVTAFAATLLLWFLLLARRANPYAGAWCALLLAANPVLFRYGYSATTDALSVALQSASVFALLAMRGRRAPLWAGLLAALAILTRYNLASLIPASLLCLWLPGVTEHPRRAAWTWLLGLGAVLVPWTAYSLARGHVPGEGLLSNFGFYADTRALRQVQDWMPAARDTAAKIGFFEVVRRDGPGLVEKWGRAGADHLVRDLGTLVGWPAAALAGVAILAAAVRGTWRRGLGLAILGAFAFLALVPVFYSDRYSLALLPFYMAAAACGIAAPFGWRRRRVPALVVLALAGFAAVGPRAVDSVRLQQRIERDLPREVLESARALRAIAPGGGTVMARKAHIGYYAHLTVAPFPRVPALADLASAARDEHAGFLYFSWVEAQLRPEFSYLLDTTGVVPGLEVVHATDRPPSVTYRIGPAFGTAPAWFASDTLRNVHTFRGLVQVQPDSLTWRPRIFLGVYELMHGHLGAALAAADGIVRARPDVPEGWLIMGEALMMQGRYDDALRAYEALMSVDPGNVAAIIGAGRVDVAAGRLQEAARLWRPMIDRTGEPAVLEEMARLFETVGDEASAKRARGRMGRGR